MLPRNHPDRIQIAFDDHRLVANAGLLLPVTLAACPRNTGVEWFGGIIGVVQQRGAGDEQELPSL